jgi:hypothetical protein
MLTHVFLRSEFLSISAQALQTASFLLNFRLNCCVYFPRLKTATEKSIILYTLFLSILEQKSTQTILVHAGDGSEGDGLWEWKVD